MKNAPASVPQIEPRPAEQAGAADHDGGDRVELVELAGARIAGVEARGDEHAGEPGRRPHIVYTGKPDAVTRTPDSHAASALPADRVHVPAERRAHQHQPRPTKTAP